VNDTHIVEPERDDEPEWTQSLRHDWSLPNILSDQMFARLNGFVTSQLDPKRLAGLEAALRLAGEHLT
jgi:hypothetical protein